MSQPPTKMTELQIREAMQRYFKHHASNRLTDPQHEVDICPTNDGLVMLVFTTPEPAKTVHVFDKQGFLQLYAAMTRAIADVAVTDLATKAAKGLLPPLATSQPACPVCRKQEKCSCSARAFNQMLLKKVGDCENCSRDQLHELVFAVSAFAARNSLAITADHPVAQFLNKYAGYLQGAVELWELKYALATLED